MTHTQITTSRYSHKLETKQKMWRLQTSKNKRIYRDLPKRGGLAKEEEQVGGQNPAMVAILGQNWLLLQCHSRLGIWLLLHGLSRLENGQPYWAVLGYP